MNGFPGLVHINHRNSNLKYMLTQVKYVPCVGHLIMMQYNSMHYKPM